MPTPLAGRGLRLLATGLLEADGDEDADNGGVEGEPPPRARFAGGDGGAEPAAAAASAKRRLGDGRTVRRHPESRGAAGGWGRARTAMCCLTNQSACAQCARQPGRERALC